jgi:hypothetical protein
MAASSSNTEIALQICFGIFSVVGIMVTVAGIHYRDSLAGMLLRNSRIRSSSSCIAPTFLGMPPSRSTLVGQTYLGLKCLTKPVDDNLPSRAITPSQISERDIELGLVLPPSHIDQALRTQENNRQGTNEQGQERIRLDISRATTDSLTTPTATYDRSRSPSISCPAAA